jgi:hypothetical protein
MILQTKVKLFFKPAAHSIHNGSPPFMASSRFKPVTVKTAHVSWSSQWTHSEIHAGTLLNFPQNVGQNWSKKMYNEVPKKYELTVHTTISNFPQKMWVQIKVRSVSWSSQRIWTHSSHSKWVIFLQMWVQIKVRSVSWSSPKMTSQFTH